MWSDIIGHEAVVERLKGWIAAEKIPHALLFAGQAGLGKTRVAREFFKALNCEETPGDGCDHCRCCRKVEAGTHPDLWTFTPEGKQVDQLRALLQEVALKPYEAKLRIIVIEPAERLNPASANALLKTLEEPPPGTLFVLIAHQPAILMPTIISRCQVVRFVPLEAGALADREVDPALLRLMSGTVGGIKRLKLAGVPEFKDGVLEVLSGGDPFAVAERFAVKGTEDREKVLLWMAEAEAIMRDVMVLRLGGEDLVHDELFALSLEGADYQRLERVFESIQEIRRGVQDYVNLKAAMGEFMLLLSTLR